MLKYFAIALIAAFLLFAGCAAPSGNGGTGGNETNQTACTKEYNPMCGKDGVTYGNPCMAEKANVEVAYTGACRCTDQNDPVCGSDGKDYDNECFATAGGSTVAYKGKCEKQEMCTTEYAPVCGKDAKTYGNACAARVANVMVAYEGECAPIDDSQKPANIANPASVNCVEKGGQLRIEKDETGGEIGICTLADGKECEEWAYFRGECPITPAPPSGISAAELAAHSTRSDCWVGYQGKAYDVTAWLPKHPGSAGAILPYCGTSSEFEAAFTGKHGTSKVSVLLAESVLKGDLQQ